MRATGGLAGWVVVAALALGQGSGALELSVVRFYRGANALTLVDGFCRVPVSAVSALSAGPGAAGEGAAYRVSLTVRDSAGLELTSQTWSQAVARPLLGVAGASVVEHFAFAAPRGRYVIDVAVTDSATGRVSRARSEVSGFAEPPGASDLLLAAGLRVAAAPADTVVRPGEIRKGDLFIETSGRPVLTPEQSHLGYYLELYTERPETASVVARVRNASGAQVVATQPQRLPLAAGGGVTRGLLDLGGLPPGAYRLDVTATLAGRELARSADFGMAGFETETAIDRAAPAAPADRLVNLSESQLDSLYAPLIYVMSEDEHGIYPGLTLDGKRNFLRKFWTRRDPTPGTPRNEEEERFYAGIAEANRRFREGGSGAIPGWRTDRGRIFLRYGSPDEKLSRPQAGSTAPYEVWKYTKTRARKFVFYDVTRFGNYALIWTDERREPSRPNWRVLLGPEAAEDVQRF
ncbi:MAG TPA: GWxTD domain-containing protein [Gemmatimonadales bacterium]|nr:GWxTD domain-containing protein [Gemmatimonadales bacterium]